MGANMARFVVDLGDLPLTAEEHNGIASAIHAAVIGHLAGASNPGLHAATKTLNHAGMGFAAPSPASAVKGVAAKAAVGKAVVGKAGVAKAAKTTAAKITAAKPVAAARAGRKLG
jgi:hypothetical protein